MSNPPIIGDMQAALIALQLPQEQLKQARFTTAIGANERNFLPRIKGGAGALQQKFTAALQAYVIESNHAGALYGFRARMLFYRSYYERADGFIKYTRHTSR